VRWAELVGMALPGWLATAAAAAAVQPAARGLTAAVVAAADT
jgi:hypothetical protein